jgi:hypothetical protein
MSTFLRLTLTAVAGSLVFEFQADVAWARGHALAASDSIVLTLLADRAG